MKLLCRLFRLLGLIATALAFYVLYPKMLGMGTALLVQPAAALVLVVFPLLYQGFLFGLARSVQAVAAPFNSRESSEGLLCCQCFFRAFGKSVWLFTAVVTLVNMCFTATNLSAASELVGYQLAASLVPFVYALMLQLLIVHPYTAYAAMRLNTAR